eukprot:scaffold59883_cov66-Cyclotella_meneghiniana.AAC.6
MRIKILTTFLSSVQAVNSPTLSNTDVVGINGIGSPNPGNPNDNRETHSNGFGSSPNNAGNKNPVVDDSAERTNGIIGSPNPGNHPQHIVNSESKTSLQNSSVSRHKKQSHDKQRQKQTTHELKETTQHQTTTAKENIINAAVITPNNSALYHSYMHWCEAALGIQSVVEIKEFEYIDHLTMYWENSIDDTDDDDLDSKTFDWLDSIILSRPKEGARKKTITTIDNAQDDDIPITSIRGLAAKHDIQVGDIVISIPLYSLLSVPTTIDHDPVLSRILGPNARQQYGWTNTLEYEVPLLVIAILYHKSLGQDSPLWRYIDLLSRSSTEYLPFLWSDAELKSRTGDIGVEVRELSRGIRRDVWEMYDLIMGTLVQSHVEIFGPPEGYHYNNDYADDNNDGGNVDDWYFSYKNFQWAFAMVISRHHFLPIAEFDEGGTTTRRGESTTSPGKPDSSVMHETLTSVSDLPPANQPTDRWVEEAINEERVTDDIVAPADDDASIIAPTKHSFMAPLADLINFGPPCLTGSYNNEEHAFELIATCPFKTGQEITFWYSSDCSDVIVANYGFLHPLVPPCKRSDDWKEQVERLEEKDRIRQEEIWDVYRQMDLLKEELSDMDSQLIECGCRDDAEKKNDHQKLRKESHSPRHEIGVRGHSYTTEDHDVEDL